MAKLRDYENGKCDLFNNTNPLVFIGIYNLTQENPCNGCFKESICTDKPNNTKKHKTFISKPTNAELAEKLGVSKRQVSKLRAKGILNEE